MQKQIPNLSVALIIGSLLMLLPYMSSTFQQLEYGWFDFRMQLNRPERPLDNIVLFEVSSSDYPHLMTFLELIKEGQIRAIALDLPQFSQQYQNQLHQLAQKKQLPLVIASQFEYQDKQIPIRHQLPPSKLQSAFNTGFSSYAADSDGIYRRLPLGQSYRTSQQAKKVTAYSMIGYLYQIITGKKNIQNLYIHYTGPPRSYPIRAFSLSEITELKNTAEKILIFSSPDLTGIYMTPYHVPMQKLELHANALQSLLEKKSITHPQWLNALLPVLMALLIIGILQPFQRWGVTISALAIGAFLSLFVMANVVIFNRFHIWLHGVFPALALLTSGLIMTVRFHLTEGRERRQLATTFKRHLPDKTVRRLLETDQTSALKQNEKRVITVMFADITGFAKMSEKLPPDRVMQILNEYLTAMTEIIFANQGTLDKYMGDGIMAVYGNIGKNNPKQDAYRAIKTALEMQEELERLQHKWMHEGLRPIQIRIGLNTGEAFVGYVGHEKRKEVTVIGDSVNTAARLEQLNKQYQTSILISKSTYEYVSEWIESRPLGEERLKGKSSSIFVHEVKGWKVEAHDNTPAL